MYFYTYKFIYIMWNILHLSAFLLVVPTIFYQCTDKQVEPCVNSQKYRNICREWDLGKGAVTLITLLTREGRGSNYWFNSHTVTNTDSSFYGKRFNPTEKRGLTPNIVLCTHIRLILYFNAGRHSLKGD